MIWTSSSITNLVLCITRRKIGIPLASSYLNAVRSNLDLLSYLILSRAPNTLVLFPLKFHLYSTTVIAPLHNSLETGQHMLNSRKYESVVLSLKNRLQSGFCNEGNVKSAFEVIARMIVSSFMPEERTYSAVITAYCKMGLLEKALDIFKQAKAKNMCMDSETSSELIEGLCGVKRIEEATEMFYYLTGKGCSLSPWALSMLIQETCLVGKVCEAVKLHSKATSNGIFCTPMAYATIMVGLLNLKKEKDLLPLLAQMFTKGCILDGPTYATIVCSFCTKSTIREGAVLFNKMIHDGFFPDSKMLEMVVFNTTASSLLNKVVHSLIKVINQAGLLNPRICNTIIYGLVKEGYKHEASKFLDQMLENGWVPDPQTHGLLVGNVNLEESDETGESHENYFDDRVSNILAEDPPSSDTSPQVHVDLQFGSKYLMYKV
ncbi:Pentatricopeptide repeat-containing protein, chloroplastic [Ananas comosus]|uniref:Pentatricopeptide repeat-containing protein, chloroplastic n=1 Tax=Ananas comosus TaxID=4615 RepID=A0A199VWF8_ANACO|nr:Pentatricopeptide repeat-containing protein, chloroplastic [Ananas comosus]